MAFEDSDRRRAILLALVTLIAVPVIWLASRPDEASAPAADGSSVVTENGPSRPPIEPPDQEPVFLEGPSLDPNPGVAEVAVPARPEQPPIEMSASYRSTVAGVRTCLIRDLGSGLTVTVTNLDNGRTIECVTSIAPFDQVAGVVLHTETFAKLADLTEAPIPVEVIR